MIIIKLNLRNFSCIGLYWIQLAYDEVVSESCENRKFVRDPIFIVGPPSYLWSVVEWNIIYIIYVFIYLFIFKTLAINCPLQQRRAAFTETIYIYLCIYLFIYLSLKHYQSTAPCNREAPRLMKQYIYIYMYIFIYLSLKHYQSTVPCNREAPILQPRLQWNLNEVRFQVVHNFLYDGKYTYHLL